MSECTQKSNTLVNEGTGFNQSYWHDQLELIITQI